MVEQYSIWYHKKKYLSVQPCALYAYDLQSDHPFLPPKGRLELSIVSVADGEATISIGGNQYVACTGDFFILTEAENARIHAVLTEKFEYQILSFDPMYISPNGPIGFDHYYLTAFYDRQHMPTHKLSCQREPLDKLQELFSTIAVEVEGATAGSAWRAKVLLLQILLEIQHYYQLDGMLNPDQKDSYSPPNQTVESIISYIDENLSQSLSLSMFAEIAHMNPFYFSTYFKKHTSMSPSQYVLYARINRAKKLLAETDKNILDIALLCGFNSTANFNKAFKKATGKTPSEYRENLE